MLEFGMTAGTLLFAVMNERDDDPAFDLGLRLGFW